MFTIEFALIFGGLHYTTASRAVLFLYTAPFFIAIGAHLALPGDRLTPRKLVGLACAFAGVGVAMGDGLSMPTGRELVGDAMCLLAAAAWGATTIVIRLSKLAYAPAETTLLYQLLVSALALIAFGVAIGEPGLFNPTPVVIGSLVFQIAIVAFASYLVWFWMVTRYPASRLAAWTFLTPAFGVLFGHLMLNDPVTPLLVASLALIAAGIYLVNRPTAAA
jgi:drug/metabolite transporter (DMT)-like permease